MSGKPSIGEDKLFYSDNKRYNGLSDPTADIICLFDNIRLICKHVNKQSEEIKHLNNTVNKQSEEIKYLNDKLETLISFIDLKLETIKNESKD